MLEEKVVTVTQKMRMDGQFREVFARFLEEIDATEDDIALFQENAILSGGAIASIILDEAPKDYDVYFRRHDVAERFRSLVTSTKECTSESEFAALHSSGVQIVTKFFGEPKDIIKSFDFKHATNYWTYQGGVVTNTRAVGLVYRRQLQYEPTNKYPLSSFMRVVKFCKRGWNIQLRDMLMLVFKLQMIDLTDINQLLEQTKGVDPNEIHRLIDIFKTMHAEGTQFTVETIADAIDEAWEMEIPF